MGLITIKKKTMNTLKRLLKKEEDLWCDDDEDDPIEELSNCIKSLKR